MTTRFRCPHCGNDTSQLLVRSRTVLTLTCQRCAHVWSLDLTVMSPLQIGDVAALDPTRGDAPTKRK
jgi:uncharacterized Zn finger protein